jgi:hypothetical protein
MLRCALQRTCQHALVVSLLEHRSVGLETSHHAHVPSCLGCVEPVLYIAQRPILTGLLYGVSLIQHLGPSDECRCVTCMCPAGL